MYVIRETHVGDFVYSGLHSVPLTWRIHLLLFEGRLELYERPKKSRRTGLAHAQLSSFGTL
jgi:hypothetical protein